VEINPKFFAAVLKKVELLKDRPHVGIRTLKDTIYIGRKPNKSTTIRCYYCGNPVGMIESSNDHIVAKSKNGSNDKTNLVRACNSCNSTKSASLITPWLIHMQENDYVFPEEILIDFLARLLINLDSFVVLQLETLPGGWKEVTKELRAFVLDKPDTVMLAVGGGAVIADTCPKCSEPIVIKTQSENGLIRLEVICENCT